MQQVIHGSPLADQVYSIVHEQICGGAYVPSERLSQEQIAKSLNVSRQPVLQALGLLKAQGFLCSAGRRGLMVSPLEVDFVIDLYEYRAAVDLLAASRAPQRCTSELSDHGSRILEQGEAARKSASLIDLSIADMNFHQWVYQVAGNRVVIESMNHYWSHIRRVMCAILRIDDEWPSRVWEEHRAIHQSIISGNSELAKQLARLHVEKASEALRSKLLAKVQNEGTTDG